MKKRHSMAWMPFGAGPRNCVGMRFALMQIKLTLVTILCGYTFEMCAETEIPINVTERRVIQPKHGLTIKLKKR